MRRAGRAIPMMGSPAAQRRTRPRKRASVWSLPESLEHTRSISMRRDGNATVVFGSYDGVEFESSLGIKNPMGASQAK
jgi:hypothetical protein